eukprot:757087-Amphidinium_carterae.1
MEALPQCQREVLHPFSPYANAGIGRRCGRDPQVLPYTTHTELTDMKSAICAYLMPHSTK